MDHNRLSVRRSCCESQSCRNTCYYEHESDHYLNTDPVVACGLMAEVLEEHYRSQMIAFAGAHVPVVPSVLSGKQTVLGWYFQTAALDRSPAPAGDVESYRSQGELAVQMLEECYHSQMIALVGARAPVVPSVLSGERSVLRWCFRTAALDRLPAPAGDVESYQSQGELAAQVEGQGLLFQISSVGLGWATGGIAFRAPGASPCRDLVRCLSCRIKQGAYIPFLLVACCHSPRTTPTSEPGSRVPRVYWFSSHVPAGDVRVSVTPSQGSHRLQR